MFSHSLLPSLLLLTVLMLLACCVWPSSSTPRKSSTRFNAPIPEVISYGSLGSVNTTRRWYHRDHRMFNPTPRARHLVNVSIRLYTRDTDKTGVHLWHLGNLSTPPQLDCTLPTKLLFHGWMGTKSSWMEEMKDELLRREPANVFIALWSGYVGYLQATQDIRVAALDVSAMIKFLVQVCGLQLSNVHLIGHSLGAHLAGYVGEQLRGIARITGLDPAKPGFKHMPSFVRLDTSDAELVDVIHTDTKSIIGGGLGMLEPTGHMDFYPNAGKHQPGCDLWALTWEKGVAAAAAEYTICSHSRAPQLFIESINSGCHFVSFLCSSFYKLLRGECADCGEHNERCTTMGFDADKFRPPAAPKGGRHKRHAYFLTTSEQEPFCRYPYSVTLFPMAERGSPQWGHLSVSLWGDQEVVKDMALSYDDDLTGRIPVVNIRVPNPLSWSGSGPQNVVPGKTLRLFGDSSILVGSVVTKATLSWEGAQPSMLMRLVPCVFRCSYTIFISKIEVRIVGVFPSQIVNNVLCPENGEDRAVISSGTKTTFSAAACQH